MGEVLVYGFVLMGWNF